MRALKLGETVQKLAATGEQLNVLSQNAAVTVVALCVAQLNLHPDEWTNIKVQVQEAYKLADALKLKKDQLPAQIRDVMEQMRGKSRGGPASSTAQDVASQAGSVASDAKVSKQSEDVDTEKAVDKKQRGGRGRGRGGASGRGAKASPGVRRTGKRAP